MRKTKIVKPRREAATTMRWKCSTCRTWVNEAINMQCAECTTKVSKAKAPKTKASPAPKMFSDLGDMFGISEPEPPTDGRYSPRKAKS